MNQPSALREPEDIFTQVTVRPLCADDSPAYHALRSRILALGEGKYFSDSYLREKSFVSENDWREWCTEKREHCTIGTFIGSELVGTMGIVRYGTPEDRTVEWEVTWMDPRYRNCGLARQAYEKVEQWTRVQGYKHVVLFIRADNLRSRAIRKKQGAIFTGLKPGEIWADGSVADAHCFRIDLHPKPVPLEHALHALEDMLAKMQDNEAAPETMRVSSR
jgi:RimJ/RimL family protein N-acetyltransferase